MSVSTHHILALSWELAIASINDTRLGARRSEIWTIRIFAWATLALPACQARIVVLITSVHAFGGSRNGRRLLNEVVMVWIIGGCSACGSRGCCYFAFSLTTSICLNVRGAMCGMVRHKAEVA